MIRIQQKLSIAIQVQAGWFVKRKEKKQKQ
jgi:hypothetical protein